MKVACISDIHGHLVNIEPCDLLLIAGDICGHAPLRTVERFGAKIQYHPPIGSADDMIYQAGWLNTWFKEWLKLIPVKEIVATPGNHDFVFERAPHLIDSDLRWTVLIDDIKTVLGKKIYGSPWQHWFYDWAYNAPRRNDGGEEFLTRKYDSIPDGTDIFVVHGPPYKCGDSVRRQDDIEYTGSVGLSQAIRRVKPQLSVHGHIHVGRGVEKYSYGNEIRESIIVNAAICNEENEPVHEAMYFDIEG